MSGGDPPRAWSLRGRLTRRVLGAVCLGWIASLAIGLVELVYETNELLDDTLKAQANLTLDMLRLGGAPPKDSYKYLTLRVITPDGVQGDAPWPPLARDGGWSGDGWHVYRVSDPESGLRVELGQAGEKRWTEILEVAEALLLLMVPILLVGLVVLRRTVRISLAPALHFAQELGTRPAADTSPLTATGLPRELAPVPKALNSYLQRIDALLQHERQFAANAAHELRTPLAAALAQAQLIASGQAAPGAALRLTASLRRLTLLIERLLQLSRAEAGIGAAGQCDLIRVIRLLIADHETAAIVFDDADLDTAPAGIDADVAALILGNLLRNAIEHGTGKTEIRLRPGPEVVLRNRAAPGAAFRRARFDKAPDSAGAGLGLVIVETLAGANGVALDFAIRDGIATVRAGFPPPRAPATRAGASDRPPGQA